MEGAAVRWAGANRLDDATLTERIGYEFGIQGGYSGDGIWIDYWGGRNPRIEIRVPGDAPIQSTGRDLLAAVREALRMNRPGELF